MSPKYLFKTNGIYFGFIHESNIFSRDGVYLGWVDGRYAWDINGNFRGEIVDGKYILKNQLTIPAISRPPKPEPLPPSLPAPTPNISPTSPRIGYVDSF